jgi:putative membrane protein
VLYACGFMAAAGVALFASDRMALSRPRGAGVVGSLSQFLPPLVVLVLR